MPSFHYSDLEIIVLAAGKGTRMRSQLPKVLHPVLGTSMLSHVLQTSQSLNPSGITVVVGHEADQIRGSVVESDSFRWVHQSEQLGTGHAVNCCQSECSTASDVLIVCGDTPLLQADTLSRLVDSHRQAKASVSFLSAKLDNPTGYGRVQRDVNGSVRRIVEQKDAAEDELSIHEVSSGIFCVRQSILFELLQQVNNENSQGEYYLPDIIPLALISGQGVQAVVMMDPEEMSGVNDRRQLAEVESVMQSKIIAGWQVHGVTIEQPETVRIESSVTVGRDCIIRAGSQLLGSTTIGHSCSIGPYAVIQDACLGDSCQVHAFSHVQQASLSNDVNTGPFARLRPESNLKDGVRIGNFVEIKKSNIGCNSKVNHLSYIGDTNMGENCNIGAGSITCNYDGANKHRTEIGDGVFVGSSTKLVAPVVVGDHATIGAGSIITKDVEGGGLTLSSRSKQQHISTWLRPKKNNDVST